jgi:hypothetical protein
MSPDSFAGMKIRYLIIIGCLAAALASCTRDKFVVEGLVPDPAFEGSKIYLVALDGPLSQNVDSALITGNKFRFNLPADSLGVRILRIPVRYPAAVEDLVVITEAGKIDVEMSASSRGSGTRLNDLIRGWKDDRWKYDSLQYDIYTRTISPAADPEISDSLLRQSTKLAGEYMSGITTMMNNNLYNGVGLLLFKIYYPSLPLETRKKVLELTGDIYLKRDLQLWSMVQFDQELSD